jgi:hypothetical protein
MSASRNAAFLRLESLVHSYMVVSRHLKREYAKNGIHSVMNSCYEKLPLYFKHVFIIFVNSAVYSLADSCYRV